MQPKTILHATDFSEASRDAFELARKLAGLHQAKLHLLHVKLIPEAGYSALDVTALAAQIEDAQAEHAEEKLQEMAAGDASVVLATARHNRAAVAIAEYADKHAIDLIVVGSHGYSGIDRLLLGSEASRLVRRSSKPVLVVRSGVTLKGDDKGPFKRILAPVDLSDASMEALREADQLAKTYGASLVAMHALDMVIATHYAYVPTDTQLPQAENALHAFVSDAKLANKADEVVLPGPSAMGILETAKTEGADLIVISRSGLSGWQRFLIGSTTERVLNMAECAVLVLPAGEDK